MVDGVKIKCWRSWGHGHQTFVEGVKNSCNPIFMETALRLGRDRFYQYLDAFGFGHNTGIDVSGEEKGVIMGKEAVKNVDLARMGFGQAISVTPIQLITAVSAVVNGGDLMEPHIAKEFRDIEGNVIEEIESKKIRQAISPQTSETMCSILEQVVMEGSGKNAYIPGYRVGGKTGTAQKYGSDGELCKKTYCIIYSFAPADDPQVIVLFMVDEPEAAVDFGSQWLPLCKDDIRGYSKIFRYRA